jgi:hypothetical protein
MALIVTSMSYQSKAIPPPVLSNQDCSLTVPDNPLTAVGLSTPYQLTATNAMDGACSEVTLDQRAFVQASIINIDTGAVSVYNPLVIDAGTLPAVTPVVPILPVHAVVALWFGSNGTILRLAGAGSAGCTNGTPGSPFGQFS